MSGGVRHATPGTQTQTAYARHASPVHTKSEQVRHRAPSVSREHTPLYQPRRRRRPASRVPPILTHRVKAQSPRPAHATPATPALTAECVSHVSKVSTKAQPVRPSARVARPSPAPLAYRVVRRRFVSVSQKSATCARNVLQHPPSGAPTPTPACAAQGSTTRRHKSNTYNVTLISCIRNAK